MNQQMNVLKNQTRTSELQSFFNPQWGITQAYRFFCSIITAEKAGIESLPPLELHNVKNVTIPNYDFAQEDYKIGIMSKTYPILQFKGFQFVIEFEEDDNGLIAYLITCLQKRIISEDGAYVPPDTNKIDTIVVEVQDEMGNGIVQWQFLNCYYISATPPKFDYASTDSIKYGITFGCDIYQQVFYKQ